MNYKVKLNNLLLGRCRNMCQILHAEQYMGAVALACIQNNRNSISMEDFYSYETKISNEIYKESNKNIIMNVTRNDIFSTIEGYSNLFTLEEDTLLFHTDDQSKTYYSTFFLDGIKCSVKNQLCNHVRRFL